MVVLCFRLTKLGYWSAKYGLNLIYKNKFEIRKDLTGVHFDATSGSVRPPEKKSNVLDVNKSKT